MLNPNSLRILVASIAIAAFLGMPQAANAGATMGYVAPDSGGGLMSSDAFFNATSADNTSYSGGGGGGGGGSSYYVNPHAWGTGAHNYVPNDDYVPYVPQDIQVQNYVWADQFQQPSPVVGLKAQEGSLR